MSRLPIEVLNVTQDSLRHFDAIDEITAYVSRGGFWTPDFLARFAQENKLGAASPMIQISRFEDGKLYLHDGHHRTVGTLFVRNYLRHDEFQITRWKYRDYMEVNLAKGWFTPYDPRTHVREADIGNWKATIRSMIRAGGLLSDIEKFIFDNQSVFCHPRNGMNTVADLARLAEERKPLVVHL